MNNGADEVVDLANLFLVISAVLCVAALVFSIFFYSKGKADEFLDEQERNMNAVINSKLEYFLNKQTDVSAAQLASAMLECSSDCYDVVQINNDAYVLTDSGIVVGGPAVVYDTLTPLEDASLQLLKHTGKSCNVSEEIYTNNIAGLYIEVY